MTTKAIDPDVSFLADARTLIAHLRGTGTWRQALHAALRLAIYAADQLAPDEQPPVPSLRGRGTRIAASEDREVLALALEAACDRRTVSEGNHPRAAVDWKVLLAMIVRLLPLLLGKAAH